MKPDTKQIALKRLDAEDSSTAIGVSDGNEKESGQTERPGPISKLKAFLRAALFENFSLKLVALILASTVFVLVHSDEQATVRTDMSISYGTLENRVLVSERVDHVQLTLQGSRRRIRRFNERSVGKTVYVELENKTNGYLVFENEIFTIPEGLNIVKIEPEGVSLRFEEKIEKRLPVYADTLGIPARGLKVSAVSTKPDAVLVAGASSRLKNVSRVRTKEIHLGERDTSFQTTVELIGDGFELVEDQTVEVQVSLGEELDRKIISNKKIQVLVPQGMTVPGDLRISTEPGQVDVLLYGTAKQLEEINPADLEVVVFAEPEKALALENHNATLKTRPVYPGVAITVSPASVKLLPTMDK